MMFSAQTRLIISAVIISSCRAQEDSESQSPRLISNENSATLTGAALGLGIGVAGSLIVSKLIDDAAKCKPPAIGKLIPLPDLLKFNPINPDCNKVFSSQASNYRETQYTQYPAQYPTQYPSLPTQYPSLAPQQYPSQGYDVIPLSSSSSSSYKPAPVQLTPTFSYSQQTSTTAPVKLSSGFSQTSSYNPQPNPPHTSSSSSSSSSSYSHSSQGSIVPSQSDGYYHQDTVQVNYVPNPAIQPRGLSDLFSPVASQSTQFTETEAVKPEVDNFRTGKAVEGREASAQPVLFQPLTKTELNKKITGDSGFSQTEAVVPEVDSLRTGKALESQPVLFQPLTKTELKQKAAANSGFSETDAVTPSTDNFKNGNNFNSEVEIIQAREIETLNQRLVKNSGFSETEAVSAEPDVVRSAKQLRTNSRPVLFKPVAQDKLPRHGKSLTQPKAEPKPFTVSLSGDQGDLHPVSAIPDLSQSKARGPKAFSLGA